MFRSTPARPTDVTTTSRRRRARAVTQRASVLIAVGAMAATAPILAPAAGAATGSDHVPTVSTSAAATATGWTEVAPMSTKRAYGAAATLADGRVLVAGGYDGTKNLASSELYDPATGTWQAGPNLPAPMSHATATTLTNGKVLVAGGGSTASYLFNPTTGTWQTGAKMPVADNANFAGRLANGRVIVVGNYSTTEYNPARNKWKALAAPSWGQFNDTAAILPNGNIVAAARMGATTGPSVYNRAKNTWTTLPPSPQNPGYGADVVALPNGNVMVGGGWTFDPYIAIPYPVYAVTEVNPATGQWTIDPPLNRHWTGSPSPTDGSDFVVLSNGSVLATGGDYTDDVDYVYTAGSGTWAPTPGRDVADLTLVTLNDGSLMSVGGNTYGYTLLGPTAKVAIFHP